MDQDQEPLVMTITPDRNEGHYPLAMTTKRYRIIPLVRPPLMPPMGAEIVPHLATAIAIRRLSRPPLMDE